MKKSTPKLKLNRETLRNLEQLQLEGIAGGITAGSACIDSCRCSRVSCLC